MIFGDSLGKAFDKFGAPISFDFLDGLTVAYQGYRWAGTISVYTTSSLDRSSTVEAFFLENQYGATTSEGIGIGSPYQLVLSELGTPQHVVQEIFNIYCLGDNFLQFGIKQDTVRNIFFGRTIPGGELPACSSNGKDEFSP